MRRLVGLVVVVLLVAGGISAYFYAQSRGNAPRYRTLKIEKGRLTAAVSATGNLNAVTTVQVGTQVSGQVKELFADFNTVVKKGQLIARIDPELFEAKVNGARGDLDAAQATVLNQTAQVEKARAEVENARSALAEAKAQTAKAQVALLDAKRDLDRKSELLRKELIAKSEMDSSQAAHDSAAAQLDSAKAKEQSLAAGINSAQAQLRVAEAMHKSSLATVEQKKAALRQTQVDLDHTRITAPVDGVIVSRAVDVGQTVAASLQAPVLFTIAQDLTKMQVETSVDEADIGRIKLEDRATFTVDAFPGETFGGTVTQIRKAAQIVQNVVTYTVVVGVGNPGGKLLPGMTANVKLIVAEKQDVLKVPNAALRFRPAGVDGGMGASAATGGTGGGSGGPRGGGGAPSGGGGGGSGGGAGGAGGRLEALRERLVSTYKLDEAQQGKLDAILQETRGQFAALQGLSEAERQARIQKNREATRAKIREILTPEQRARFDADAPSSAGGGSGSARAQLPGRVWIQKPDGKLEFVQIMLGISDGQSTEIVRGELKEGHEVVVGVLGASTPGARSPSGPRLRL